MKQMASLPNRLRIARYWILDDSKNWFPKITWEDVGCFACGFCPGRISTEKTIEERWLGSRLERAHLIPLSSGGPNTVDNVVLLCKSCHAAAPMVGASAHPMVKWINGREAYVNAWFERILTEARALDPELPEKFAALNLTRAQFDEQLRSMLAFLKAGYHPGGDILATITAAIDGMVQLQSCLSTSRAVSRRIPGDVAG